MSTSSSVEAAGTASQGEAFSSQQQQFKMHSGHSYGGGGGPLSENTPTLNHLLQSSPDPRHKLSGAASGGGDSAAMLSTSSTSSSSSSYCRDDYPPPHPNPLPPPSSINSGMKGPEPSDSSTMQAGYSSVPVASGGLHQHPHQHPAWTPHPRAGTGHQYFYPPQGPGPGSTMYASQPGASSEMSQGRRPAMGAMSGPYPQQGGQYMGQQMPMGPGAGPQRFLMGGQMPNQMYGHPQQQMYMPPSGQPPAPSVSPAGRPPTPQQPQLQQMQNMISNSPKQPSPAPSISSDHGSTHSSKPGEEVQDVKLEPPSQEDQPGDCRNSLGGHRPVPSPVGSGGSRSNTPASIPGNQSGSPMPIRPASGQLDGQNRMTQSPMATQGYNPQMMPPPNNMGFMPNSAKMPGHYPPYNAQYPQGNFSRQQTGMAGMSGPGGMSGHIPNYHAPQQGMYPNGPSQMQGGTSMYGNMPSMNRNMPHTAYGPSPGSYPSGNNNMMGNQYSGYGSHVPNMPGQPPHTMQQGTPLPPGSTAAPMSTSGQMPPSMGGGQQQGGMMPQHGAPMNKAAQAAQAALMAAANSVNPRMPHSRGSMSPSRGMFSQGNSVGPLAQMNNMSNSPNLGSPSLNSMSNAVEQLARSSAATSVSMAGGMPTSMAGSTPSPGPKTSMGHGAGGMESNGPLPGHNSPLSNADTHDSLSRPNSTTTVHPPDLPTNDTTSSESSSGMPSDSTSVDSGFHSSDQGDKMSDSIGNPGLATQSPPPPGVHQNGEAGRNVENISPPSSSSSRPIPDPKMPYMNEGGYPIMPATSLSSAMAPMPSVDQCVTTTASLGHMTPVTQSIASPVTSVSSTSAPPHHLHGMPGSHMMGHSGMGPGPVPHGMMPNGMMNAGHMGGPPPSQMPPNMGGGPPGMMPPNMGGPNMNMNQNGPMMGPGHGGPMMGPNGPMMPPGSMGNSMSHMGQMQQPPPQQPPMPNNHPEEPPEKKKKVKDMESQIISRTGYPGHTFSEEPNSPGVPKSASDISKLFEMGPEPDRRPFLERVLSFLEESGNPVTSMPAISKTPLDLYKLYFSVREKGGFEEVTQHKKWREICTVVNIGTSASAAFTLKKNYIRYLLSYECKFDRGGVNPQPILAQMEAQLAHKREQKSKRAPSPGSNSNDAFRPPSTPNNQMDNYPPGMPPPPYGQNPDGNMANMPNMMMGPGNVMSNMPNMMGPSPGMMGGPGPNMMPGQQGGMPGGPGGNMMGGPSMMPSGPHGPGGFSGPMMPHPQPSHPAPQPSPGMNSGAMPPQAAATTAPVTSDSISVQDPFADEPNYPRNSSQASGPPQMPSPSGAYPSPQQSASGPASAPRHTGPPHSGDGSMPSTRLNEPSTSSSNAQFPFGQQFDHPECLDTSSPNLPLRHPAPPNSGMAPPSQQPGTDNNMYPQPRFPGPPQPMAGMRPQAEGPNQYSYQGQGPSYPTSQYQGYAGVPPGPYPGPRPPSGASSMYGTRCRYPDGSGHGQDGPPRDSQWSPLPRPRMPQGSPGYIPPCPPSTPPMGSYGRSVSHRNSPQTRGEGGRFASNQKGPKPSYATLTPAPLSKKELVFPSDSVEGVSCALIKRRRLNHKDLAPFEPWRLMLSLKSGQLAESTWALDTLNILLFDDSTHSYFTLPNLNGLLEVLTEHLRHCLMQMFSNFHDLEEGQSRQPRRQKGKRYLSLSKHSSSQPKKAETIEDSECQVEESKTDVAVEEVGAYFRLPGTNYTLVSRKGLPVKIDNNPSDCSVLESKDWDIYTHFETKKEHWLSGCGDITDHIFTHFESDSTNQFLSGTFNRKRTRLEDEARACDKGCKSEVVKSKVADEQDTNKKSSGAINSHGKSSSNESSESNLVQNVSVSASQSSGASVVSVANSQKVNKDTSNSNHSHSNLCNGEGSGASIPDLSIVKKEPPDESENVSSEQSTTKSNIREIKQELKKELHCEPELIGEAGINSGEEVKMSGSNNKEEGESKSFTKEDEKNATSNQPVENGDLDEPKLSPMVNHKEVEGKFCNGLNDKDTSVPDDKDKEDDDDSSPPVLKAECEDMDERQASTLALDSMNGNGTDEEEKMDAESADTLASQADEKSSEKGEQKKVLEESGSDKEKESEEACRKEVLEMEDLEIDADNEALNESYVSETEEMSASFVSDLLKEDENIEDEAFQRDDPPLCVTQESRDELGRRCVCISNIIRSLSCVPGNEARICKHPGIMRILGRLLLLHHTHPSRPAPRRLPSGEEEEEEKEEPPRVCDNDHWWWDYLDQLRENVLVILANICSHLKLGNFSEQLCFPLLEGLLHWVICPSSVARDPLPTLTSGSVLSPQRLVLEALCKLCIHETNVDLLLATPPMKRLLEFFSVLVRLLADRNTQITREFSIVLLSLLVQGDSSVSRAIALQHPCIPLLVDFIETAEQNALVIANQQGIGALQSNPEAMGTSLDMLRRAASILLHISRVPDNRKMFIPQQNRLLDLVMSQILDQSVAGTLSEVLFECSQSS